MNKHNKKFFSAVSFWLLSSERFIFALEQSNFTRLKHSLPPNIQYSVTSTQRGYTTGLHRKNNWPSNNSMWLYYFSNTSLWQALSTNDIKTGWSEDHQAQAHHQHSSARAGKDQSKPALHLSQPWAAAAHLWAQLH